MAMNVPALRFSELVEKYPNAAQAFIEEYGRRLARHVAFLASEVSLRAVWQGELEGEVMLSEYNASEARWGIEEDVYGGALTPELEDALEQAFTWGGDTVYYAPGNHDVK
jgi:hypothetical protein